ncbi:MAG: cytochrome c oxidase assembly protein [Actinomycetota bacterium]
MNLADGTVTPETVWSAWSLDPWIALPIVVTGSIYLFGVRRTWARRSGSVISYRRVAAFLCGLLILAAALLSPIDAISETLFTGHMVQHLLLMLVVAPLFVYGLPARMIARAVAPVMGRSLRAWHRSRAARLVSAWSWNPIVVVALHALVLWAWHVPAFYSAAWRIDAVHALQHVVFLGSAYLVWALVIGGPGRRRLDHPRAMLVVFATMMQSAALAAVLVFASQPLYPVHGSGAEAWGMTLLDDQSLAGALMWAPMGAVYLVAFAALFGRWLQVMERRYPSREVGDA